LRRAFIAGTLLIVVLLIVYRQRIYVRDPLARVERNGVTQTQYRIYLNYSNDILVENLDKDQRYLVQARVGAPAVPGIPLRLQCLRAMACLTDSDLAPTLPLGGKDYEPGVEMTNKQVTFEDGERASIRVILR